MTLLEEIQNGENAVLEFKEDRPKDSVKFTKTVVAFANGKGGRLIFGIEDGTRNIVGIPKDKVFSEMDAIVNAISETCTPSISPDVKIANVEGKSLIIVDVKSCPKTPYYIKKLGMRNGTFVRIGATTRGVEEYRLKGFIAEGENLSFDKQPVRGKTVSHREVAAVCRMMTETARNNSLDDAERMAVKPMTEKWLESKELLFRKNGKLVPTYAYYIVAGIVPPGLLEPRIRCGAFRGKVKGDFYDRRDAEGPIAEQIEEAYQFVVKNMRVGTKIVNSQRQEVYELPLSAVREAICNAVFHRDYLEPSNVFVAFYDDRLEITSPGGLVKDFTIEQATSGISKIRNKGLAAALEYMKDVEGWGGGVSRYFEKCAELGLPQPSVEELDGGFFRVTFYRKRDDGERIPNANDTNDANDDTNRDANDTNVANLRSAKCECPLSDKLLEMIRATGSVTIEEMMRQCKVSRPTITRAIRVLKAGGRVRRVGGTRGYWEVLK